MICINSRAIRVDLAITGGRQGRIAARVRRNRPSRYVELRQSVEGLIGIAVVGPVLPQPAKVMIEGTVFLQQKDNVIYRLQPCRLQVESLGYRLYGSDGTLAHRGSATAAAPTREDRVRIRASGQLHDRSGVEAGTARSAAAYP